MHPRLLRALNAALYVLGLGLLLSGTVLHAVLARGSARWGQTWLGWDRHQWGDLHGDLSYFFLAALVLHLGLHWGWVKSCFAGKGRWAESAPWALAVLAALALLLPVLTR